MQKRPERRSVTYGSRSPQLDKVKLAGSGLIPKGFTPWVVKNAKTEQDVRDMLTSAFEAGDPDAGFLLGLLEVLPLNDLIVEGAIRIEKN